MKPWPEPFEPSKQTLASYLGNVAELNYERARAEAAIERLRVAVEKLNAIEGLKIVNKVDATGEEFPGSWQQYSTWKSELAREALDLIGDIP